MYFRILIGLTAVALLTFLMSPVGYGQFPGGGFPGGGKGGFPGGGKGGFGQFGGFGGNKGGKGGNKGGRFSQDPNQRFDTLAGGRPFFLISEATGGTQSMLNAYIQEKGVQFANGQVSREQYLAFSDWTKQRFANGGFFGKNARQNPPGTIGTPNGPMATGNGAPTPQQIQQLADLDFKNHDGNGDGVLNSDELPPQLRRDLTRWDTNPKDDMIDKNEYRSYFQSRFTIGSPGTPPPSAVDAVLDDDLDKRPTVLRAGKLPAKGLPSWFMELDTDTDGQVALYEWRSGGHDLDEFGEWDKDDDGFITPEEALKVQAALTKSPNPLLASNDTTAGPNANGTGGPRGGFTMPGFQGGRGFNMNMPGGGFPGGGKGKGGFGGGKGKGGFGGGKGKGGFGGGNGGTSQWNNGSGDPTASPFGGGKGKGGRKGGNKGGFGGG